MFLGHSPRQSWLDWTSSPRNFPSSPLRTIWLRQQWAKLVHFSTYLEVEWDSVIFHGTLAVYEQSDRSPQRAIALSVTRRYLRQLTQASVLEVSALSAVTPYLRLLYTRSTASVESRRYLQRLYANCIPLARRLALGEFLLLHYAETETRGALIRGALFL